MSKNIILDGQTYNGVSEVSLPVSGGTALFKDKDEIPAAPSGTKQITANGTYDVTEYESTEVNVPTGGELPTLTNPASASDILKDKEAIDGNGAKLVGTCTFDADTSDADATASDIAQGKTAYVNGAKVVGTASGGGGLPAALNVLDAGVLPLTADADGVRIDFNKTLETTPKGICVWCSNIGNKDYQAASGSDTLFSLYAMKLGVNSQWNGAQNYVMTSGNVNGGSVSDGISTFTTSYITFKTSKYKKLKKQIYNASNELVDAVWNWIVFG